jgi:hypothetical protein
VPNAALFIDEMLGLSLEVGAKKEAWAIAKNIAREPHVSSASAED